VRNGEGRRHDGVDDVPHVSAGVGTDGSLDSVDPTTSDVEGNVERGAGVGTDGSLVRHIEEVDDDR
jgi:hypothetical protein